MYRLDGIDAQFTAKWTGSDIVTGSAIENYEHHCRFSYARTWELASQSISRDKNFS